MIPATKVERSSRALRAAVESLDSRLLFAYSASDDHITNAWDQSSLDVVFDTATVNSEEIVAVGMAASDSVNLFDLSGAPSQVNPLTKPDDALPTVSNFGYAVEFVGDKLAVAAFDSGSPIVYVYNSVGGVFDNTPDATLTGIIGGSNTAPLAAFGNQLLVRGSNEVYVYNLVTSAVADHSIPVASNGSQNNAIATDGTNVIVTTASGSNTEVKEFNGETGALVRTFTFGAGNISLSLAMSDSGKVFIGDGNGMVPNPDPELPSVPAVYQFANANSTGAAVTTANAVHTYVAGGDEFLSPQSLTVSGDELLVGQYFDFEGSTYATLYDTTTFAKKQELTVSNATGNFGLTAQPLSNGFAISDKTGDGETGTIHFFTEDTGTTTPTVSGGSGNDAITVTQSGTTLTVTVNGVATTYENLPLLVINGGAGNDTIGVAAGVTTAIEAHGGSGNDLISGGAGADVLIGDAGSDVIIGQGGRDVLIGGDGSDILLGMAADDVLVAGATAHDDDSATLQSISAIWNGNQGYNDRVNALKAGPLTPDVDVYEDGDIDILSGNGGTDWFVINNDGSLLTRDLLLDRVSGEIRDDVDAFIP